MASPKLFDYNSSFGVLRTNPKITGNVKITVDASENLWLNSIDSNDEMSKNQYKGYRLSSEGDFANDVYTFFNNGKTPTNFILRGMAPDRTTTWQHGLVGSANELPISSI